jgi:hypothetical protein
LLCVPLEDFRQLTPGHAALDTEKVHAARGLRRAFRMSGISKRNMSLPFDFVCTGSFQQMRHQGAEKDPVRRIKIPSTWLGTGNFEQSVGKAVEKGRHT